MRPHLGVRLSSMTSFVMHFVQMITIEHGSRRLAGARTESGDLEIMTKLTSSLIVSVFLLILPVVCFAQTTSSTSAVTGTVTDPQGAVVAGVSVKLVDNKTSQERTTTTND